MCIQIISKIIRETSIYLSGNLVSLILPSTTLILDDNGQYFWYNRFNNFRDSHVEKWATRHNNNNHVAIINDLPGRATTIYIFFF